MAQYTKEKNNRKALISVVIPSYNDKPIILPYYDAIMDFLKKLPEYNFELIYVDDGSTDGSPDVLRNLAESDSNITFIELFRNFGQQRALFAGLSYAEGDYVVMLDGDYQYPPEVIGDLVDALAKGYDLASGIRSNRQDSFFERITSKIGHKIIKKVLNSEIKDFGSVKAFSRTLADRILSMRHYFSDVYPAALSFRPRLIEIEVPHKTRPSGRSHWDLWMRLRLYIDLYVAYSDHQFQLPFKLGLISTLLGICFLPIMIIYKIFLGHQATYMEILVISYFVILFGLLISFWSLLMAYILRVYKQNITSDPFVIRSIIQAKKRTSPELPH